MPQPRIAFQPLARRALCSGFNRLAALLELTLGPKGRLVAVERESRRRSPELLDDGASIARRFTGFPDRFETMGAFIARHIAWRVEEAVGDGTTTAVVIARHILNEADRQMAAGANGMRISRGVERGLAVALKALRAQALPLDKPEQIAALATSVAGNDVLGRHIEEVFDIVGSYGAIQVRSGYALTHDRRYINGAFWNQGWISSHFTTEGGTAALKRPFILLTDRHLDDAAELIPVLEQVRAAGDRSLVVIANGVAGNALNLLVANKVRGGLPTLALKTPGLGPEKTEILHDLAAQCGGRVFLQQVGDRLDRAQLADLGQADEVQAIRSGFTLIGGKGRPAAIRQRSQELQRQIPQAAYGRARDRLLERAGKLHGGVALLEIGGATEAERDVFKDRAREAVNVVRHGLLGGVAPGGGAAYLACQPALDVLDLPDDEAVGVAILRGALAAPARAILRNSGYEPEPILARLSAAAGGVGFDVRSGACVDMAQANVLDPVQVLAVALQTAVSGALMALTTEVLVHRPRSNRDEAVDFRP